MQFNGVKRMQDDVNQLRHEWATNMLLFMIS